MFAISGPLVVAVPTPPSLPVSVSSVVIPTTPVTVPGTISPATLSRTVWTIVIPGFPCVVSSVVSPISVPVPIPVPVAVAIPVSPAVVSSFIASVLPPMIGITRTDISVRTWGERRPLPTSNITRAAPAFAVACISVPVPVVPLM
jgi:hypothetical protein